LCDIESYRLQSNGSTCTSSCVDDELIEIDELHCFDPSVYPTDLWTDSDNVLSANQFSCRSCWHLSNQCRVRVRVINVAIGGDSDESIRRIVEYSSVKCPKLEFSLCDIESYRLQSNGSTCTSSCVDDELIEIDELHCFDPSVYPTD
jgi:hypothetical protein